MALYRKIIYHPFTPCDVSNFLVLCGGEIISDNGVIESSGYPYDYLSNSDCVWLITVPEEYQVAIIFTLFQVKGHLALFLTNRGLGAQMC